MSTPARLQRGLLGLAALALGCSPAHSSGPASSPPGDPVAPAHSASRDTSHDACDDTPARIAVTLDNGLTVSIEQSLAARATVRLEVPVGSLDASRELAHLAEHLVSDAIGADDSTVGVRAIGAHSSATTRKHRTVYTLGGPPEEVLRLAWLLRKGISNPSFGADVIDTARKVVAREAEFRAKNIPAQFHAWTWEAVLRGDQLVSSVLHPLEPPSASVDEVHTFLRAYYAPAGAELRVTSPYPPRRLRDDIVALFSDWRADTGSRKSTGPTLRLPDGTVRMCIEGLGERSLLLLAVPPDPSMDLEELESLATLLSMSATTRLETAVGHDAVVEMAGLSVDDESLPTPVWLFIATLRGDHPWERLQGVGRTFVSAIWSIDRDALIQVAAEKWFGRASGTRCGDPPPRPALEQVARSPLPPPPTPRTVILVRGADACTSTPS